MASSKARKHTDSSKQQSTAGEINRLCGRFRFIRGSLGFLYVAFALTSLLCDDLGVSGGKAVQGSIPHVSVVPSTSIGVQQSRSRAPRKKEREKLPVRRLLSGKKTSQGGSNHSVEKDDLAISSSPNHSFLEMPSKYYSKHPEVITGLDEDFMAPLGWCKCDKCREGSERSKPSMDDEDWREQRVRKTIHGITDLHREADALLVRIKAVMPRVPNLVRIFGQLYWNHQLPDTLWAEDPTELFPHLDALSQEQRRARFDYWVSFMLLSASLYVVVGTLLLKLRSRLLQLERSPKGYARIPDSPPGGKLQIAKSSWLAEWLRSGRMVANILFLYMLFNGVLLWLSTARGTISLKYGAGFEFWFCIVIIWGGTTSLIEVLALFFRPEPCAASAYASAMLTKNMPVVSERIDTAKDLIFTALAWYMEDFDLALLNLLVLAVAHMNFLLHYEVLKDLTETFLPLIARPTWKSDLQTSGCDKIVGEFKANLLKQASPGRNFVTYYEDLPQGIFSLVFVLRHGGSRFVVSQIVLSVARILLAKSVNRCLLAELVQRCKAAAHDKDQAMTLALTRQILEVEPGSDIGHLKVAGYSAITLKANGFDLEKVWPLFDLSDIRSAGWGASDVIAYVDEPHVLNLKNAGYTAPEIRSAGVDAIPEFVSAGFSVYDLDTAGFDHEEVQQYMREKHWPEFVEKVREGSSNLLGQKKDESFRRTLQTYALDWSRQLVDSEKVKESLPPELFPNSSVVHIITHLRKAIREFFESDNKLFDLVFSFLDTNSDGVLDDLDFETFMNELKEIDCARPRERPALLTPFIFRFFDSDRNGTLDPSKVKDVLFAVAWLLRYVGDNVFELMQALAINDDMKFEMKQRVKTSAVDWITPFDKVGQEGLLLDDLRNWLAENPRILDKPPNESIAEDFTFYLWCLKVVRKAFQPEDDMVSKLVFSSFAWINGGIDADSFTRTLTAKVSKLLPEKLPSPAEMLSSIRTVLLDILSREQSAGRLAEEDAQHAKVFASSLDQVLEKNAKAVSEIWQSVEGLYELVLKTLRSRLPDLFKELFCLADLDGDGRLSAKEIEVLSVFPRCLLRFLTLNVLRAKAAKGDLIPEDVQDEVMGELREFCPEAFLPDIGEEQLDQLYQSCFSDASLATFAVFDPNDSKSVKSESVVDFNFKVIGFALALTRILWLVFSDATEYFVKDGYDDFFKKAGVNKFGLEDLPAVAKKVGIHVMRKFLPSDSDLSTSEDLVKSTLESEAPDVDSLVGAMQEELTSRYVSYFKPIANDISAAATEAGLKLEGFAAQDGNTVSISSESSIQPTPGPSNAARFANSRGMTKRLAALMEQS